MLENFEKIMQGTYTQIVKTEKRPKKRQGKVCYCCKCGTSGKTLYKLDKENYICIECKKGVK